MKRTHLVIGLLVIALSLGAVVVYGQMRAQSEQALQKEAAMMEQDKKADMERTASEGEAMMPKTDGVMTKGGAYVAYSPEKIALAKSGHVVLFFHASWCPTCRALDKDIKAHLGEIPANLTILDVDYDTSTALKARYGVTMQHTLVEVDANGTLIQKWTGSPTLTSIVGKLR